jgi:hypothetical protein
MFGRRFLTTSGRHLGQNEAMNRGDINVWNHKHPPNKENLNDLANQKGVCKKTFSRENETFETQGLVNVLVKHHSTVGNILSNKDF